MVDRILCYEGADNPVRWCVGEPQHLQQQNLYELHDLPFSGHFVARKILQRISQYFYWKGIQSYVRYSSRVSLQLNAHTRTCLG